MTLAFARNGAPQQSTQDHGLMRLTQALLFASVYSPTAGQRCVDIIMKFPETTQEALMTLIQVRLGGGQAGGGGRGQRKAT